MAQRKDIQHRKDIDRLLEDFYFQIKKDDILSPFFNHFDDAAWARHMVGMVDFFENSLFYIGVYDGSPLEIHRRVSSRNELNKKHFEHWLDIFYATVDKHFKGAKADLAKQRALSMAKAMSMRMR